MRIQPITYQYQPYQYKYGNKSDKYTRIKNCGIDFCGLNDTTKKDIEYRKSILQMMKKPTSDYKRLNSIIGIDELETYLKQYSEDEQNYVSTDENLRNYKFQANPHIHTNASDGVLNAEQLLNSAADYADKKFAKTQTPFIIGITDHDIIDNCQEATKIIYNNPEKYKNLKVILGCEVTSTTKFRDSAQMIHLLLYGINPFSGNFINFLKEKQVLKQTLTKEMVNTINSTYKNFYPNNSDLIDIKSLKYFYNPVDKGFGGIIKYVKSYAKIRYVLSECLMKNPKFTEKLKEYRKNISIDEEMENIKAYYEPFTYHNKALPTKISIIEYYMKLFNLRRYQINAMMDDSIKMKDSLFLTTLKKQLENYTYENFKKYNYCATTTELGKLVRSEGNIIVGIAHPLDYIKEISGGIVQKKKLDEIYKNVRNDIGSSFKFSEVYYQNYKSYLNELVTSSKEFLNDLSKRFNLYKTGSLDTHRFNILKRFYR